MRRVIEPAFLHITRGLNHGPEAYRRTSARGLANNMAVIACAALGKDITDRFGRLALKNATANCVILCRFNGGIFAGAPPCEIIKTCRAVSWACRVKRTDLCDDLARLGVLECLAADAKAVAGLAVFFHVNGLETVTIF